ncbi:MAG: hypothetical protein KF799_00505 [Bdellovibrionales bacterium]|nr:hypothetical protein [Bdellovibrionales bacterium]
MKSSMTVLSLLLALAVSTSASENPEIDFKALYEATPFRVGDLLPPETRNGDESAHCAKSEILKPQATKYDPTSHVQAFKCSVADSKSPVKTYSMLAFSATGPRVSTVALEMKSGLIYKSAKDIAEKIKYKFTEPLYDGSDDEVGPGRDFYASIQIDDNHFANLFFKPAKGGFILTNVTVRACTGDWIKPETMFSDWAGNCSVVLGKAEKYADSPAYKKKGPFPTPTTAEIEAQLNPEALYKLSKLKIGDPIPEEAKGKNEGPGYCPPTWEPTLRGFRDLYEPRPVLDKTSLGCNSKDDSNMLMGLDVWANRKSEKIIQIDYLLRKRRITAKSLADMDHLLGKAVLINSKHPDLKRFMDGSGYFFFNKIEPNILVTYRIEGRKKVMLTEVSIDDCASIVNSTIIYSICQKWGLDKVKAP